MQVASLQVVSNQQQATSNQRQATSNQMKSIGLDIGHDSVKVVELVKLFKRIRLIKFGEEKIIPPASGLEPTVAAVRRLFERLRIKNREVIIHLGGASVRHVMLEAPLLSPVELTEWIHRQCLAQVSPGLKLSQLICAYHTVHQTEQGLRLLAAYCQPQAVLEKMRLVEAADLQPIMIGAGELDMVNAFAFSSESFFKQTALFVDVRENKLSIIGVENGSPIFQQSEIQKILSSWKRQENAPIDRIVCIGDEAEARMRQETLLSEIPIEAGAPLKGLLGNEQQLPSRYSLAAGLALKKYFPLLNTIDLLPDEKKNWRQQQQEKQRALKIILAAGSFLLFILLTLHLLQLVWTRQLEAAQAQALQLETQIAAIGQVKKERLQLQQAFTDMQRLVTQRSQYARLLETLGQIMPRGVWLQEISCAPNGAGIKNIAPAQLHLRGWAVDESKLALLLAQMENSSPLADVKLISTKRLSAAEVWRQSRLQRIPLVEFIISTDVMFNLASDLISNK